MKVALYRGPATDWRHKVAHWAVCVFTDSPYSHCELVINGMCWSASARDGGVRSKAIDLTSGKWDVIELPATYSEADALAWFESYRGASYDWAGVFRFALPFLPLSRSRWFCSEACGAALGLGRPHKLTPRSLAQMLTP